MRLLTILLLSLAVVSFLPGCGSNEATLPNRVAITVSVKIDNQQAGDGSLALRPETGVKCPLVKMSVIDGVGYLDATEGPVPGRYTATFRPSGVAGDITAQLSKTGRSPADSGRSATIRHRATSEGRPGEASRWPNFSNGTRRIRRDGKS